MTRMLGRALDKAVLGECFTFAPSIQRATRGTDETTSHSTMLPEDISQVAGYQDGREMYRTTVEIIQHYLVSKRCTPTLIGLMLALVLINDSSALGDEAGQQWLTSHCGQCHGLSTDNKCVAGNCSGGRVHAVIPRAWDMVVPVMRSLGCTMTDAEEKSVTEYLMSNYGKSYPMQWARSGTIPGGWNVVAMGTFKRRLYAGIEGNGSLFELGDDATWKKTLVTPNYTIYGLVTFHGTFYVSTNDPAAEIWSSNDGKQWKMSARLPDEKGITSLGVHQGWLYAGTTRSFIYRSADGITWSRVGSLVQDGEYSFPNWVRFIVPYNGALYAGVEGSGVYQSKDGMTWNTYWPSAADRLKQKPLGARGAAVFNDALYFGSTVDGSIWRIDAKKESPARVLAPDTTRKYVGSMASFDGFLYAGIGGNIFRTADGRQWEEAGYLSPFTIEAMGGFDHQLYAGTTLPPNAWIYHTTGMRFHPPLNGSSGGPIP